MCIQSLGARASAEGATLETALRWLSAALVEGAVRAPQLLCGGWQASSVEAKRPLPPPLWAAPVRCA